MEAIQVFKVDFDIMENRVDSAIDEMLLGTFVAEAPMSAHRKAAEFISNLPPIKHYLAWDGSVYPKIYTKKITIN